MASRLVGWLVPVVAVATWQALKSAALLDYEYLPSPREVVAALGDLMRSGALAKDVAHTVGVAAVAVAISLTAGAAFGYAIGLVPAVRRYTMASVDFLRTIPAVALVPIAVLSFGPVRMAEIALATYAALWPVVLHTAGGVAAVHPRQYDVARTLRLGTATTVRKLVIPAAVPAWLVGARMSVTIALLVAIVAEMMMSSDGLGGGLTASMHALAPARMWAYAIVCGMLGVVLNAGLRRAVRIALPGAPPESLGDQPTPTPPITALRGLLPIAATLIAWQLTTSQASLSFPPPNEWLRAITLMHDDSVLTPALLHTLGTYALGLVCAVIIGAVLGTAIGLSRFVDHALTPTIDFIAAVPGAALVPVAVLLLGPGQFSGIVAVALIVSWPILLNTATAMRSIPAVRLEMSRTIGLSRSQRWIKVILPSLLPGSMLGVRVAASLAVIITLLVDIFGAGTGLGRLLLESQQRLDAAAAWGLLLLVGLFGYLMSLLLSWLEGSIAANSSRSDAPVLLIAR
jgi:sulfonate transport system permease protein